MITVNERVLPLYDKTVQNSINSDSRVFNENFIAAQITVAFNFLHQTILLGDSGVGKTSLLVQFETGKFQAGNFSATVGIGFTVSSHTISKTAVVGTWSSYFEIELWSFWGHCTI